MDSITHMVQVNVPIAPILPSSMPVYDQANRTGNSHSVKSALNAIKTDPPCTCNPSLGPQL